MPPKRKAAATDEAASEVGTSTKRRSTRTSVTKAAQNDAPNNSRGKSKASSIAKKKTAQKDAASAKARDGPVELFGKYKEEDEEIIGPEGFQQLCEDANISLEGITPLLLAWKCGATQMGSLTREEFLKGCAALKNDMTPTAIDSPSAIFEALQTVETQLDADLSTNQETRDFATFYAWLFGFAKESGQKVMLMSTATELWKLTVARKWELAKQLVEFINSTEARKGVTRDVWDMTFEFCKTVGPNFEGYDEDGAWPTLLDEFVASVRSSDTNPGSENGGQA